MAAGLFDEAKHHREPEPSALAVRFGGVEGLEHPSDHLRRHAVSGIGDRQHRVVARYDLGVGPCIGLVEHLVGKLDGEPPATRHRVARVEGQVQHRGLELGGIRHRRPEPGAVDEAQVDLFAQGAPQQRQQVGDDGRQVERRRSERLLASKGEQLARERGATLRRPDGALRTGLEGVLVGLKLGTDEL